MMQGPLKHIALGALLFLALLSFLFLKTRELSHADRERFQKNLRVLKQLDTELNQNILKSRFRLLSDYDAFAEEWAETQRHLQDLARTPFFEGKDLEEITKFQMDSSALLAKKNQLVEQFKSQNAVLNNSRQYFPLAANELLKKLSGSHEPEEWESTFRSMVFELLDYTLATQDREGSELSASISRLREWNSQNANHPQAAALLGVLTHAESILRRKPIVDDLTRKLMAVPTAPLFEAYFHRAEEAFTKAQSRANVYRLVLYCVSILLAAAVVFTIWALQSANRNLDLRVHERTSALCASNADLRLQIEERKRAEAALVEAQKQMAEQSRLAGMAEVATSVLHNVGNVLNSVNVSSTLLVQQIGKSRIADLQKLASLVAENAADLGGFFSKDPRGAKIPEFLRQVTLKLGQEQEFCKHELASLQNNIAHIKDIVAMQQSYATISGVTEVVDVAELVEDTLRMSSASLSRHEVEIERQFEKVPAITTDKHKVLQILVNLVKNAKNACDESDKPGKRLKLCVNSAQGAVRISVTDNGVGIPSENLNRIFNHGFTTKKGGHGFGLHNGALAAKELGGSLTVESSGPGQGARFTLELPCELARN